MSPPVDSDPGNLQVHEKLVDVYYPAGYDPAKRYPLQVMLDGDMHLRTDVFGQTTHTRDILDNLVASGKMEPAIAVFTSPTTPTAKQGQDGLPPHLKEWDDMPRLREYACDTDTDSMLACIPSALDSAGVPISQNPKDRCLGGQSMGGLQALYTAVKHPDVYGKALPQSPAVWWGPGYGRLPQDAPGPVHAEGGSVRYDEDETWRAPLTDIDRQCYLERMLATRRDDLTGTNLPHRHPAVVMQAGTRETGFTGSIDGPQGEPLTQAARALAQQQQYPLYEHNGGHDPGAWATGLSRLLPIIHPPRPSPTQHAVVRAAALSTVPPFPSVGEPPATGHAHKKPSDGNPPKAR